jgi:hypothetical protein
MIIKTCKHFRYQQTGGDKQVAAKGCHGVLHGIYGQLEVSTMYTGETGNTRGLILKSC